MFFGWQGAHTPCPPLSLPQPGSTTFQEIANTFLHPNFPNLTAGKSHHTWFSDTGFVQIAATTEIGVRWAFFNSWSKIRTGGPDNPGGVVSEPARNYLLTLNRACWGWFGVIPVTVATSFPRWQLCGWPWPRQSSLLQRQPGHPQVTSCLHHPRFNLWVVMRLHRGWFLRSLR